MEPKHQANEPRQDGANDYQWFIVYFEYVGYLPTLMVLN